MRARTLRAIALSFALALAGAAPAPAQTAQAPPEITSATPSIIAGNRENALKNRAQAAEDLARAQQWRETATRYRAHAGDSKDAAFADQWRKDADAADAQAAELEKQARDLTKLANDADAEASRLESAVAAKNAPPPAPPKTEAKPADTDKPDPALALADVIGLWNTTSGPNFTMAILSVAGPGKPPTPQLVAHTNKRVWKGTYAPAASGPIVKLTYAPKPEEMNAVIPDWARAALAGKLVWRIELAALGDATNPGLAGKWYAGEVTWDPDSRDPGSVRITGDGKPWEFELEPNDAVAIDALMRPMLGIRIQEPDYDADANPPEALTQGQLFSPYLTVPAEMAKGLSKIAVTVSGISGGASETIELKPRGGRIGVKPVTFMPDEPVMISADCAAIAQARRNPRPGTLQWLRRTIAGDKAESGSTFWTFIAGDDPGPCLDMKVANGESLRFSAQGAAMELPIYDSWVQHGIARHKVLEKRLRLSLAAVAGGRFGAASTAAARLRQRMLDDYDHLVGAAQLTDLHRYYLGELYFGDTAGPAIALMDDMQLAQFYDDELHHRSQEPEDPNLLNPLMKAFLEGLSGTDLTPKSGQAAKGINWTSPQEEAVVVNLLRRTSDKIAANALQGWVEHMTFGGYEGLVAATGAGQLWLLATGTDHHGMRQSGWERFFAAVNLASNAVLSFTGAEAEEAFAGTAKTARLGTAAESESVLIGRLSHGVEEVSKETGLSGLPSSLSAAERDALLLKTIPDVAKTAEPPIACALRAAEPATANTLMDVRAAPGNAGFDPFATMAEKWRIEAYVQNHWGPEATFVDGWRDEPLQELQGFDRPTCNMMAANRLAAEKGGIIRSQAEGQKELINIMRDQLSEFSGPSGAISFGKVARKGDRTLAELQKAPGFLIGFDNLAIRDYLRSLGAKVLEMRPQDNQRLKLRHIWALLENGYGVKVIVDFARPQRAAAAVATDIHELHAVVVEGMVLAEKNGRTVVSGVQIYDSNVGRLLEVPAKFFDSVLARDYREGIVTAVKFGAKSP